MTDPNLSDLLTRPGGDVYHLPPPVFVKDPYHELVEKYVAMVEKYAALADKYIALRYPGSEGGIGPAMTPATTRPR